MGQRRAHVVDLAAAEPERGEPVEVRDEDELAATGQGAGQAHQLGMLTPGGRQPVHEEQRARGGRGTVEIGGQRAPVADGNADLFTRGLGVGRGQPLERGRRERDGQAQRWSVATGDEHGGQRGERDGDQPRARASPHLTRTRQGRSAPGRGAEGVHGLDPISTRRYVTRVQLARRVSMGVAFSPRVPATASWTMRPRQTFTPRARAGSARTASRTPRVARATT